MTPVERLQAAIEKLETLRDSTPDGPWESNPFWSLYQLYSGMNHETQKAEALVLDVREASVAELVSVLHRTIDAQLAILRSSAERGAAAIEAGVYEPFVWSSEHRVLALADAILGGDS